MKNSIKSGLILSLALTILVPGLFVGQAQAASYTIGSTCGGNERLIYAQDIERITPGSDDDSAIIHDRNGFRILRVNQQGDDFVTWPTTVEVSVLSGETLNYRGWGNHKLNVDFLDANHNLVNKLDFSGTNTYRFNVYQNGFIRFNQGEKAKEYNVLVLCAPAPSNPTNPNPNPGPGNQPPVWSQVPNQSVGQNQTVQFAVFATDPNNNPLIYSAFNIPSGATFNASSRFFSWTPSSNQLGTHAVTFRVTDGTYSADMNVAITVVETYQYQPPVYNPPVYNPPTYYSPQYPYNNNCYDYGYNYNYNGYGNCNYPYLNRAPIWSHVPSQEVYVGQTLKFTAIANDPDGDYVNYETFNIPSGAQFNYNDKTFTWTPTENQAGIHYITFRAYDRYSQKTDLTVSVKVIQGPKYVTPIYTPPVIITQPPVVINQPPVVIVEKLVVSDIKIEKGSGSEIIISWYTNKSATSEVMYGLNSQAGKTKDYSYDRVAVGSDGLEHRVTLSNLDLNQTYYFRVFSKTYSSNGEEKALSDERSFVALAGNSNIWGLALFASLVSFIGNPWFWILLLILVIVLIVVLVQRRKYFLIREEIK